MKMHWLANWIEEIYALCLPQSDRAFPFLKQAGEILFINRTLSVLLSTTDKAVLGEELLIPQCFNGIHFGGASCGEDACNQPDADQKQNGEHGNRR